ncbi:hypothetical protein NE237_003544 [Protea cynaroides]|uniref:Uncharacterized protein n=1 Tax=Protea cynaroides TaxID=273540 RepID=A0A9Q0KHA6_9MAGN|nr:hypothetical protein NE237_003544 [Protea cynaroides]
MEDRRGMGSVIDQSSLINTRSDSKVAWRKRSNEELGKKTEILRKRNKMRDLESVFRSEGSEPLFSKSSMINELTNKFHLGTEEETCQITEEPVTKISDNFQTIDARGNSVSLSEDATRLSLGHFSNPPRSMDLNAEPCIPKDTGHDDAPANVDAVCKPFMLTKNLTDHDTNSITSRRRGLDLNAEEVCSSVYHDQFFTYKSHEHLKSRDLSECGSSTGPLDEKDSLRLWKEMKQNGFLSSSHGGIPIPKQRGRKSKNDMLKRKMELVKREQVNRFTKIAAPSGLLNELNPGIINHVRNSKQVHSIIKALVRSEKLENGRIQSRSANNLKRTKEMNDRSKDMETMHDSGTTQLNVPHGNESGRQTPLFLNKVEIPLKSDHMVAGHSYLGAGKVSHETSVASHITSGRVHETLPLKLSSSAKMASENTSSVSSEASENQATVSSLSLKAATIASQWMELLHQDIRGRLSALRRSKKRVQAVIQTELPLLLSKELSSNQENDPCASQSSAGGCPNPPNIANPEMHQTKWTSLFEQMEKALSEEGRHLESWLNQVTEMRLHCDRGLQPINWFAGLGLPHVGRSENESRLKNMENPERELAIRAVAASIYSTCNYATSMENVSCF